MLEKEFEKFLYADTAKLTAKAVASRMARARKAEGLLQKSLDIVVSDDNTMYHALLQLRENKDPTHSPMQNAVRKYYIFKKGKEFPQLRHYHE